MKQEPGNASSQESPGFSRGEQVKDEVIEAGGELLLDGSQTMHRYARHLKPWARLALVETVAGLSVVDGMITLRH